MSAIQKYNKAMLDATHALNNSQLSYLLGIAINKAQKDGRAFTPNDLLSSSSSIWEKLSAYDTYQALFITADQNSRRLGFEKRQSKSPAFWSSIWRYREIFNETVSSDGAQLTFGEQAESYPVTGSIFSLDDDIPIKDLVRALLALYIKEVNSENLNGNLNGRLNGRLNNAVIRELNNAIAIKDNEKIEIYKELRLILASGWEVSDESVSSLALSTLTRDEITEIKAIVARQLPTQLGISGFQFDLGPTSDEIVGDITYFIDGKPHIADIHSPNLSSVNNSITELCDIKKVDGKPVAKGEVAPFSQVLAEVACWQGLALLRDQTDPNRPGVKLYYNKKGEPVFLYADAYTNSALGVTSTFGAIIARGTYNPDKPNAVDISSCLVMPSQTPDKYGNTSREIEDSCNSEEKNKVTHEVTATLKDQKQ